MMKVGCCAYSYRELIEKGEMTLEGFLDEARRLRLDGVELTGYYFKSMERPYLYNLKRLCLGRGLSIPMVSCGAHLWSPSREETKKDLEDVRRWADAAYELGAPCLRVFGGRLPRSRSIPGYTLEDAIKGVIEGGKACAKYGAERGVVIALENHGALPRLAEEVVRIIEGVGSEWFRLNLDTGHAGDRMYEDMESIAPYAVHVHAKIRARPPTGAERVEVDYKRVRRLLEKAGYNGWVSIEYEEKEDPLHAVPKFAEHLLEVFS